MWLAPAIVIKRLESAMFHFATQTPNRQSPMLFHNRRAIKNVARQKLGIAQ
jgi:hypothetical protein